MATPSEACKLAITMDIISLAAAQFGVGASSPSAAIGYFNNLVAAQLDFYNLTRHPATNLLVTNSAPSKLAVISLAVGNLAVIVGAVSLMAI